MFGLFRRHHFKSDKESKDLVKSDEDWDRKLKRVEMKPRERREDIEREAESGNI